MWAAEARVTWRCQPLYERPAKSRTPTRSAISAKSRSTRAADRLSPSSAAGRWCTRSLSQTSVGQCRPFGPAPSRTNSPSPRGPAVAALPGRLTRTLATRVRPSRPAAAAVGARRCGSPDIRRIRWAGSALSCCPAPAGVSGSVRRTRSINGTPAARNRPSSAGTASSRASRTTGTAGRCQPLATSRKVSATQSLSVPPPGAGGSGARSAAWVVSAAARVPSAAGPGRCSRQLTGALSRGETAQTLTACWALSTWPSAGTKRLPTPTLWVPAFGISTGRTTQAYGGANRSR